MKILVISHSAVVDAYREKYHRLAQHGCEVHLVLPSGWPEGGPWIPAPRPGRERGIWLHPLPGWGLGHLSRFVLWGLGRLIRVLGPDLVHMEEEPFSLIGWKLFRLTRRLSIPFVFFTWENILRSYAWPLNWIDRRILSHTAWAIAGNQAAEQVLRQRGFRGQCEIIPQYGVNPETFSHLPQASAASPEFRVGYFGRLVEAKGIATLLKAVRILDFPCKLILTGHGPYRAQMERQIWASGLQARVEIRPSVPHQRMPAALRDLDVLVLPSETRADWKEQFGRVLVEAMACGVPVVGSNSGEIPHVIGDAGLVFAEGQAQALAQALQTLHEQAPLQEELRRRGRQRVLDRFTTERIAFQILGVYRRMLAGVQ